MTDNDIFRPNTSIKPTQGPISKKRPHSVADAGRRVQRWSWLVIGAVVVSASSLVWPDPFWVQYGSLAVGALCVLNAVVGVGWILSIGHLGGAIALRAESLEAGEWASSEAPTEEADGIDGRCPACAVEIDSNDKVCPGCGIALR